MAAALPLVGSQAFAHGFGARYDLPVPLGLYLFGAGAAVILSFAVVAWFLRERAGEHAYRAVDLFRWRAFRRLASPAVVRAVRVLSVALFALVVLAALFGTSDPDRNLAPVTVWVVWWIGLAYVSALVGDVWRLVNPWKIVFEWVEALARRVDPESTPTFGLRLPAWVGVWPAFVLFLGFAWLEIVSPRSALPGTVANAILLYSAVTWSGMVLFGKEPWLRRGEAFTLAFGLFARFAPLEVREGGNGEPRVLVLRPYGVGLLTEESVSTSRMAFVVLLLATVTFDGFTSTTAWVDILVSSYRTLPSISLVTSLGLLAAPVVFLALYLLTCAAMALAADRDRGSLELGRRFVLTLVPIALSYHLGHYLTYLLIQGQLFFPLLADPFGAGWTLFGPQDYSVDVNVVPPSFAWYTAVLAVVAGHVVAVWLAHVVALRTFGTRIAALRSQLPMLALMVAYTVISLWILAAPIVVASGPG